MDIPRQHYPADVTRLKTATRPLISIEKAGSLSRKKVCPSNGIGVNPILIHLVKCIFCGACAKEFRGKITFSNDEHFATRTGIHIE